MIDPLPITGNETIDYIPQKPPMSMIDSIIEVKDRSAVTSLLIQADNIFCFDNQFQAPGLTENIAQTVAAHAGYLARSNQSKPPIGFIGAISKLKIERLPLVGERLVTEISIEHEVMNFTLIKGISRIDDKIAASCEMKIFVSEKPEE